MKFQGIVTGVLIMLIGLAVWELFVKKMVIKNAYEAYYDNYEDGVLNAEAPTVKIGGYKKSA